MTPGIAAIAAAARAQDYAFPAAADDYALFYPTAYYAHFGAYDWTCGTFAYQGHLGSDFGAGGFTGMDEGRTIAAGAAGVVVAVHDGEFDRCNTGDCAGGAGFGNHVKLEHADGKSTIYGHLKQWSVAVAVGDSVQCGQPVGEMGSSGFSTGPHVHFEVRNVAGLSEDPFEGDCSAPPSYWVDQGAYRYLPGADCGEHTPCAPVAAIGCGDHVDGDTAGPDAAWATWAYGCTAWTYSGPELSYTLSVLEAREVTVSLTGLGADLDLYVLVTPACDGTGCLAASASPTTAVERVTFAAEPGAAYTAVVDGWGGARGPFVLDVTCADPVGPGDPPSTDARATGDTDDTAAVAARGSPGPPAPGPCGCGSSPFGSAVTLLALAPAFAARRRR